MYYMLLEMNVAFKLCPMNNTIMQKSSLEKAHAYNWHVNDGAKSLIE